MLTRIGLSSQERVRVRVRVRVRARVRVNRQFNKVKHMRSALNPNNN